VTEGDDKELALKAAAGCRTSFAALLERHYDRIYRLAWRWCGSRERAEDIAQDVCVKLAGAMASYRGEAAFSTWAYRIAYTTTIDAMRGAQRLRLVDASEMMQLADEVETETAEDQVIGQELWKQVRSLPPQQRDAVLLIYGEDMSHAEAAHVLGCTEKTVSWHVHEAKKRLRVLMEAVG
jgi:RNA polymerase sigma-70 factor, ECF subfamily